MSRGVGLSAYDAIVKKAEEDHENPRWRGPDPTQSKTELSRDLKMLQDFAEVLDKKW